MQYNQPDILPSEPLGKLKPFSSLDAFLDYFDNLQASNERIPNGDGTYEEQMQSTIGNSIARLTDEEWFGKPLPQTYEEGYNRSRYQLMDEFNDIYLRYIQPRLNEILKDSKADLEIPAYKYNDLGLGMFDYNKASTGLVPKYEYFSFEKNEMVDGNDVATIQDGKKYKYVLKSDNSPCVLVPFIKSDDKELLHKVYKEIYDGAEVFSVLKKYNLRIGGKGAFGSIIKKSYILKENVIKPKNAIRIFIKIGQNCNITGEQYKWSGYAAIGIAQLLSSLGNYSVNINAISGNRNEINLNQDGNLQEAIRWWGINLKSFEETLDVRSILYVASDPSFFRIRLFNSLIKQASFYKDYIDGQLGSMCYIPTVEDMVFNNYGKRDKLFLNNKKRNDKSQFLYYVIGDIYSLDDMNKAILEIGMDVVNRNKVAKEMLLSN